MKYFLVIFLTCFFSSIFAQNFSQSGSTEALAFYSQAEAAYDKGQMPEAKSLCKQALQTDPAYFQALNSLGKYFRAEGDLDSAAIAYQKSLEIFPRGLNAHQELAAIYQMDEEYELAITQYKKILDHFPGHPEAYYGMALVHFNQKQHLDAIKNSELAMRIYLTAGSNKAAADARMLAGKSYLEIGEPKKAIKYFKASKKQLGEQAYFPYYMGLAHLSTGSREKASDFLGKAKLKGFKIPAYVTHKLNQL